MSEKIRNYLAEKPVLKGYLFAFLATLGMANVYVFSKAAMAELSIIQFGFYWFGLAMFWSLVYMIISTRIKLIKYLDRKSRKILILIGLLELLASVTMFMSIRVVENPAVVSFLSNLTPIFVTILGISFLAERFNLYEGIGILLTVTGAVLISHSGQGKLSEIFIEGTGLIVMSSFFLSLSIILAKYRIREIHPSILMINRIVYLFLLSLIMLLLTGQSISISPTAMFNVAMGSLLGPFMTAMAQYSALKYIEASRTMIVQSTRGLFVAIGAIIYLGILPTRMQIIGGTITILGVIVIATGRMVLERIRRKQG